MDTLTFMGFSPGDSLLHRLDPRTKQILLILAGGFCLNKNPLFLGLMTLALAGAGHQARLSFFRLIKEIRYFLFFLAGVFAVRVITLSDHWTLSVDPDGLQESVLMLWGLVLVVVMGILLMVTTRISHIRAALVWFLAPVPFVNERSIATMVGLMVRFLPLILFQAAEMADAQRARGIDHRKNPLYRLSCFTFPLFRRIFLKTDDLAAALQARCYTDNRTLPQLVFSRIDALILWAVLVMMGVSISVFSHP
ncbi:energy-coupling factor transporter transmembrane protein EcfT [Desulfosarcina sp. OttesenSCG-928-A07]|nr:energy-coupling factor transporter transmembrane protein EcfT [Desulfosarcina sp. OttesenSCG-928-G17]MDL2329136.1 energy-coupling factor transporter transmembrane protein EcfT [Desulfosarcina sp. OttesenSCG-928-A07]